MSAAADARTQLLQQRLAAKQQQLQTLAAQPPKPPLLDEPRHGTPATWLTRHDGKLRWLSNVRLPWEKAHDAKLDQVQAMSAELQQLADAHPELPLAPSTSPSSQRSSSPPLAHSWDASDMMGDTSGQPEEAQQHARPPAAAASGDDQSSLTASGKMFAAISKQLQAVDAVRSDKAIEQQVIHFGGSNNASDIEKAVAALMEQESAEDDAASHTQPATAMQQPNRESAHAVKKGRTLRQANEEAERQRGFMQPVGPGAAPLPSIVGVQKAVDRRISSGNTEGGDTQQQGAGAGERAAVPPNMARRSGATVTAGGDTPITEQQSSHWQQQMQLPRETLSFSSSPPSRPLTSLPPAAALSSQQHTSTLEQRRPLAASGASMQSASQPATAAAAHHQPAQHAPTAAADQQQLHKGQRVAVPQQLQNFDAVRGTGEFDRESWGMIFKDFGEQEDGAERGGRWAVHQINANGEPMFHPEGEPMVTLPFTHHIRPVEADIDGKPMGELLGADITAAFEAEKQRADEKARKLAGRRSSAAAPAAAAAAQNRSRRKAHPTSEENEEENQEEDDSSSYSGDSRRKKKTKTATANKSAPASGSTVTSTTSSGSGRTKGASAAAAGHEAQSGDGGSVSSRGSKSSAASSSKISLSQMRDGENTARQAIHAKIQSKQKDHLLNIGVPVARIVISVNNSRKMRQRGVTEMSAAIKGCGWSRQCTLSASIYSGEELVALGYNAEVLKKKKADLLSDVKAGLVPKVGGDRPQEEKDLADPNKDVFALVFDGQHRTQAVEKLSAELRKLGTAARKKLMFHEPLVRGCIYEHLTAVEQVMVSSSLNCVSATTLKETLFDRLNTMQSLIIAYNKDPHRQRERIDPIKVTFSDLCRIGSLCAAADSGGVSAEAEILNQHVFKRVVFNTFHFIQVYGPDALQSKVFDPESPLGEPEDSLLHLAYDRLKGLGWLPKFAELGALKQEHPALESLSSFAFFVYTRLIHCRDATKQLGSGSNKMSESDPRYLKHANVSAATVAASAAHVYMVWAFTLLQIEGVKKDLKKELESAAEYDHDLESAVTPGVFEAGETQLKNQLLARFSPSDTWTEVHVGEPSLAEQCSKAVKEALNSMDPNQHTFAAVLAQLKHRAPDFISREISELKKHRLTGLVLIRETREKNQIKVQEDERRKAAELEAEAAEQRHAADQLMEQQQGQPMDLDEQQKNQHVGTVTPDPSESEPVVQQPFHPPPPGQQNEDADGKAVAAAEPEGLEGCAEAAPEDEGIEARIQTCVDQAVENSRFLVGDATQEPVVRELQTALKELSETLDTREQTADFIFLDAPKQGDNFADRFERRLPARDLSTLVSRLVPLLRPGGILAILCDTDQRSRLWVSSQDDAWAKSVWVVAPLDIVYSPDAVPKGNQHVHGPLDVNLHVLVLEKRIPGSTAASTPPVCLSDDLIKNEGLIKKMQLVEKPHFRRKLTIVEGYKRTFQVTLPRVGQPSNPAGSQLEERAHVGLSSLWRESGPDDSVRKTVCLMDESGQLDVPKSLKAAGQAITELLQKKQKQLDGEEDAEALTADEAKFLDTRSQTRAMLNERKASDKQGETDDEEAGEGGAAAAKGKAAQGGAGAQKGKAKAKPRAMAVLNSEVSVELVQLLIARFVKVNGTLLAADVCCGTGAVQRALVTLGDILMAPARCASLDMDPHVLYYTQKVHKRMLEQFFNSYLTADRILSKQSRSQTVQLSLKPTTKVSGTQLLAELETLLQPASKKKQQLVPVCHCCGVTLLEVRVVKSNTGYCFDYISKAGVVHKFFCGQPCFDFLSQMLQQVESTGKIRNTCNLFPKEAFPLLSDGMDSTNAEDSEAVMLSLQAQAEKYSSHLQICPDPPSSSDSAAQPSSRFTIKADGVISTGTVICGVIGEIRSAEDGDGDQSAQQGGLRLRLDELDKDKQLELMVSSNSLAARMQRSSPALPANAVIAAHYALLQHGDSPLVKKHLLVPGAFVVVAESSISPGELIVLEWPADNMAPKPIDKLAVPRSAVDMGDDGIAQGDALSQGITRLPADVQFGEEATDVAQLHTYNEGRLEKELPLVAAHAHLKSLLPNKLEKAYGKLVALAEEKEIAEDAVLGELLSVACFRTAVHIEFRREEVNLLLEEPTSEACKVLTAFNKAFTAQEQSNVRARLVRKASSRLAAASLPNELAESEFDSDEVKAEAKEWEDAEQDRSLAWLRSKHKEEPIHIVNRAYCKELEFVLTTQKSRQELVGMAEFIALGTCAQWFDTSSLDEDPIAASTACLQAWLDAVMAAIQDKELLPRLERAKESFEKQHREFFPWVIVKSLCALAIQIDGVIRSRSKAASPPPSPLATEQKEANEKESSLSSHVNLSGEEQEHKYEDGATAESDSESKSQGTAVTHAGSSSPSISVPPSPSHSGIGGGALPPSSIAGQKRVHADIGNAEVQGPDKKARNDNDNIQPVGASEAAPSVAV